jgi:hypothetical protein
MRRPGWHEGRKPSSHNQAVTSALRKGLITLNKKQTSRTKAGLVLCSNEGFKVRIHVGYPDAHRCRVTGREAFKSRTYPEFRPVSLIVPIDFSALITTLF